MNDFAWLKKYGKLADSPLARRYIFLTVSFGALLSLILTGIEALQYYRSSLGLVETEHSELFESAKGSLSENIWRYDVPHLKLTLDDMTTLPSIDTVQLLGDQLSIQSGPSNTEESTIGSTFQIERTFEGETRKLGSVVFTKRLAPIYWSVVDATIYRLFVNVMKAFFLVAFSLFIFRKLVSERLKAITHYLQETYPLEEDPTPLELERNHFSLTDDDELDQITGALNNARQELAVGVKKLADSQSELLRSEKLRVVGEIAANISHDVNNALSPALMLCQTLGTNVKKWSKEELEEALANIETSVKDASAIVDQMRALYATKTGDYSNVDLFKICQGIASNTRLRANEAQMDVSVDVTGSPIRFFCSPTDIREILINLANNAVDAIEQNGTVTIHVEEKNGYAAIEIVDNGIGMDSETKEKCLESFYTTKGEAGTGLGLSNVKRILASYKGEMEIETKIGAGTRFTIFFPLPV